MTGRIQLALNVDDLGESIAFYRKLFGAEPAKVRPGAPAQCCGAGAAEQEGAAAHA